MTVASFPGSRAPRTVYVDGRGTPIAEAIETPSGLLVWGRSPLASQARMVSLGIADGTVGAMLMVANHERSIASRAPRLVRQIGTYIGDLPADICIAADTNPWIEINGATVTWPHPSLVPDAANDCEGCAGEPLPGVVAPMDSEIGIQRCDNCQLFEGDLPAALALAACVGGVVKFEQEPRR
ncbi:hypothetical protein ACIA49_39135 [Kribbella sp. NPDC051587]|uniref:hypothetical protein n=1 Tax=Kribbella sp. NPDC051587 TaxID=3364119 RepID=UPI0037B53664